MVKTKKKTSSKKVKKTTRAKKVTKRMPTYSKSSDEFDSFFLNPFESFFKPVNLPSTDIVDKGKSLQVTVDLPGIEKKDIKITVQKNFLEIYAEKKNESKIKKKNYFAQERSYSGYHRKIALPTSIDSNKTKVEFKNGVLKIELPKLKKTEDKPKVITLK